jgi:hypothetical protein
VPASLFTDLRTRFFEVSESELLAMLREKDETIAKKDRLLEEQMQTVKLLTDQRAAKRPWWKRLW